MIKAKDNPLIQAGFASDHSEVLTTHAACKRVELQGDRTLSHQCDTLSGDSGSPLWIGSPQGPLLIGVQSSAPKWFNRSKADNIAVSVLQLP